MQAHLRSIPIAQEQIPLVDLAPLVLHGDPVPVAAEITRACEALGFFYIANHGIDETLRQQFFALAQRFFALPIDAKEACVALPHHPFRGYFAIHGENNDPGVSLDLKEGFDVMAEASCGGVFGGPNRWPDEPSDFRQVVTEYYRAMTALCVTLMKSIAVALDLPPAYFCDKLDGPLAILRMLHYPPQHGRVSSQEIGTGEHTDYGLLTVLAQDEHGGLQIRTRDEQWVHAEPIPGTFVVNIGDELRRWSNGRLPSSPHRVINVSGCDRFSAPFFFHAAENTVIDHLPTCGSRESVADGGRSTVTAGELLLERYRETFWNMDAQIDPS